MSEIFIEFSVYTGFILIIYGFIYYLIFKSIGGKTR